MSLSYSHFPATINQKTWTKLLNARNYSCLKRRVLQISLFVHKTNESRGWDCSGIVVNKARNTNITDIEWCIAETQINMSWVINWRLIEEGIGSKHTIYPNSISFTFQWQRDGLIRKQDPRIWYIESKTIHGNMIKNWFQVM